MDERKRIAENVEQEIKAIMDVSDKKDKQRMKRSIYDIRAAVSIPDLNKQAYRPQVVSFGPFSTFGEMQEHKERASAHFLRRSGKPLSLFVESLAEVVNDLRDSYGIKSATKLNQAGIQFQKSKTRCLDDISFQSGVLKLPVIVVDETTESIFLNLIAYESLHVLAGTEVTSYFILMRSIIKDKQDVALLHSKGIIQNGLESDQEVAKLFNSLQF
ncbi:hypothetical protein GH714_030909 [Hevea brasiliensis]|uniref:Uncharacterized protein n=1 Tax=Hevea brasiliensis TaxID=3981 RepID=A0A6A6N9C2_HEVBR|nr:hypothetical protein GH714_030909 [Hevea brasiliensis]